MFKSMQMHAEGIAVTAGERGEGGSGGGEVDSDAFSVSQRTSSAAAL